MLLYIAAIIYLFFYIYIYRYIYVYIYLFWLISASYGQVGKNSEYYLIIEIIFISFLFSRIKAFQKIFRVAAKVNEFFLEINQMFSSWQAVFLFLSSHSPFVLIPRHSYYIWALSGKSSSCFYKGSHCILTSSVKCSWIIYVCHASQSGEQEGPLTFTPQLVEVSRKRKGSPNKLLSRMKINDIFYQTLLAQASKCQEEDI